MIKPHKKAQSYGKYLILNFLLKNDYLQRDNYVEKLIKEIITIYPSLRNKFYENH